MTQGIVQRAVATTLAIIVVAATNAFGQGLPEAQKPEDVGLSSARLARLTDRMKTGVKTGELPGAVVIVARRGKVAYFETFGLRNPETKAPMTRDAIFRIASMTKPFTSLAIMMLAEEGALSIAEPVTKFLPEFKNLKVGVMVSAADGKSEVKTEALRRDMTIQDLLRHTSGLTYGAEGNNPLKQAYVDAKVEDRDQTLAEMVTKLSKLALIHQPGTTWEYGMSADVLGRIVEIVSGVPFDKFIQERITRPLKLVDTGFSAPEGAADRGARPGQPCSRPRRLPGRSDVRAPEDTARSVRLQAHDWLGRL
jgi:CubicO group peptidase (beta-lactamase class C family)